MRFSLLRNNPTVDSIVGRDINLCEVSDLNDLRNNGIVVVSSSFKISSYSNTKF